VFDFLKRRAGSLLLDRPRFAWPLFVPFFARQRGRGWLAFRNRDERLLPSPEQRGYDCDWQWTSDLNVARLFPSIARRLLQAALAEWPIRLQQHPNGPPASRPLVSFVIGHRGLERLPHLLATIASIHAQENVPVECVVVEQSWEPQIADRLPLGVRHLFTRTPKPDMPYARAWAFNVGARAANGEILVFHDNDILVPARYAAELARVMQQGYKTARLQRFLFYLQAADSEQVFARHCLPEQTTPEIVRQNWQGGTLALQRDAYFALGGHDETFIGWGGEDNEMFDRCRTMACYSFGYLPFVHLHHSPQPGKSNGPASSAYFQARMRLPAAARIAELTRRSFGLSQGPVVANAT
jgi:hypothetical protein